MVSGARWVLAVAAARGPNPTVRSELAFQSAQRATREAAEAMRRGDPDHAKGIWLQAAQSLDLHAPAAAPEMRGEIEAEASMMRDLAQRAEYDDPGRLSKFSDADWHMKMRKRGRRRS